MTPVRRGPVGYHTQFSTRFKSTTVKRVYLASCAKSPRDTCDVPHMVQMITADKGDTTGGANAAECEAGLQHGDLATGHALSHLLLRPWQWLRARQGFQLLADQAAGAPHSRPDGTVLAQAPRMHYCAVQCGRSSLPSWSWYARQSSAR